MLSSLFWKPYSRLLIVTDKAGWVLDEEAKSLATICESFGLKSLVVKKVRFNIPQLVHYTSQFALLDRNIYKSKHRISIDYFHGKGEQSESLKKCFEALQKHHAQISRIRVSTKEMEMHIKSSGIAPEKIVRIPIGIDTDLFKPRAETYREMLRKKLELPTEAWVIGSFQKDGVGWGEGLEPKLIKGPDIFLKVVEKLKHEIPQLFVLLSGPARGYMREGLKKLDIPFKDCGMIPYAEVPSLYDALDLYLITSREEGGPKACLEAMAKGVPLVTTLVGQCADLVKNGENAMMAGIDNVDGLSALSHQVFKDKALEKSLIQAGLKTAHDNSYQAQLPLWQEYFKNLITS